MFQIDINIALGAEMENDAYNYASTVPHVLMVWYFLI
jgi:hypothetical protein